MKKTMIFIFIFSVVVLYSTVCGAAKVLDVPGIAEAEDPEYVEHLNGLGNVSGWWAFWSNGSISVKFSVKENGLYKLAVQAAGTAALNPDTQEKWPKMLVEMEGANGSSEWEVKESMGSPKVYYTDALVFEKGEYSARISFINDYGRAGEDRNLFIDWVGIGPVADRDAKPALTLGEKLLQEDKQAVVPDWVFDREKTAKSWKVWKDCKLEPGKETLKVNALEKEPLAMAPRTEFKAEDLSWITLVMKADKGTAGEILWFVKGKSGVARHEFPVIADNQFHTYVIDMFSDPGWEGTVEGIAVRPSNAKGAKSEFKFFRAGEKPKGPAEIIVREFAFDNVINPAGQFASLVCVLENAGGEPARNVNLRVSLPQGMQMMGSQGAAAIPVLEKKQSFQWTVISSDPSEGSAEVDITGDNFAPVSASANLAFSKKISVSPVMTGGRVYPPEPVAAKTKYLIGAYYFPGWKQGTTRGWDAIRPFPERKPVLGWYQEGEPDIASWQIKWAVEHGISFFAYDWYWDRGARSLEHALHDGYFNSMYRKYLKFCLLWANHNPKGSSSEQDLLNVTKYWIDNYFKLPEYLKIDGKPVVIIFSVDRITEDMGVAATKDAFEKMENLCRENGFDGLYLAGCAYPGMDKAKQMQEEGYDAITGYNYPAAGSVAEDGNRPPYESAISGYREIWEEIAGYKFLDYIAVADPGWDARPWAGESALVRTGKNPAKFKKMLEFARSFADKHPVGEDKSRVVLVESWNEFGEGDYIEPHREFGFGYLDAIREVFAEDQKGHIDVTPRDIGLEVKQWVEVKPMTNWEFDKDDNGEGWGPMMGLADFSVKRGVMKAAVTGGDPAFAAAANIDASKYRFAVIKMKIDKGNSAQLFWTTASSPESERNSLSFSTSSDTQFHEYLLRVGDVKSWRGEILRLRLDPNYNLPGAVIELDYIRFSEQPPPAALKQ
ncbi:hypothetical protein COS16_10485 [Candidatus Desantisbacteria bacterium CG02_land_8_20_14_3_00_49_13]|nr:MAG: hypothetical protein COS16_10485 [Candidatus Desantisbacteria bacterium CG02_land_8_20_14_3_00_49_13]PJB27633.1 MAG: hypothetical protein CO111_04280 [Candidatus Desantisbacteria bacterium CG_4_9_14_3_um_filter_50_7]